MKRILLFLLLFSAFISACTKNTEVVAQVKAQAAIDDKLIQQYLQTKGLTAVATNIQDTTGVYCVIDTPGTVSALYTSSTTVTVGYTGASLATGVVFAQTDNFHPSFILGQVIRGWQLGIPQVKQGGTITLFVPSRDAYGPFEQPNYNLPANSVLIFTIKVYNVTNN
jgi:FKBP-type peptidyl-prolyl cis-trans isomerase FkpA